MKKYVILSWVLLAVSVALAIISYLILPDTVITQISTNSSDATRMPKLFAVLLPFALGGGGALFSLFANGEEKNRGKSLIVSVVGIVVFIIMLIANL